MLIEQSILGKRIVAVAWLPVPLLEDGFELQSITLEGGIKLGLSARFTSLRIGDIVVVEIEEKDANT